MWDSDERLERGLRELDCEALLVFADSSIDPDMAAWVGPVKVGLCLALLVPGRDAQLAYFSPMDRDGAAASGLSLLTPEQLGIGALSRSLPDSSHLAGAVALQALQALEIPRGRVAVAGHGAAGDMVAAAAGLQKAGWTAVSGGHLASMLRKAKDLRALAAARRTAVGTCIAFRRVAELLAASQPRDEELWLEGERLRVGRIRLEVARALAPFDLEQPHGNLISPGEQGAVPHNPGDSARILRPGETLVVDLFPRGWMFADCTRTFCVGEPSEAVKRAYEAVREVLELVREKAVAGSRGGRLQDSACGHFRRLGYPTVMDAPGTTTGYVHGLGHGVGCELHEYPSFRREAGEEGLLEEGDLITLEPGLYNPEKGWGIRLEDLIYLGSDGPELLTPLPYDLDPKGW